MTGIINISGNSVSPYRITLGDYVTVVGIGALTVIARTVVDPGLPAARVLIDVVPWGEGGYGEAEYTLETPLHHMNLGYV